MPDFDFTSWLPLRNSPVRDFSHGPPSTPANMSRPGTMYQRPHWTLRGAFEDATRESLNEELTANVQREFQCDEGDSGSVFEEHQPLLQQPIKQNFDFLNRGRSASPPPEYSARGYMQRSSAFSIASSQAELSFLEWYPRGDATITYLNTEGDVQSIAGLSPWIIEERCPLLAEAFEPGRFGPRLHLEALTTATATPFVRYLYTGSYALYGTSGDLYEDVPTSVLLHCQLYRLGDIYDLPDLKQQASVNVTRQCEFGCSSPDKPIDLRDAIKFLYEHLPDHSSLIETIICYCVSCFLRHRLADDFEFRTMAYNLRPFQQDLCKESMKREFEDDTAAAIIQMPFKSYSPDTYASREDFDSKRLRDVVHHFHGGEDFDSMSKKRKRPEVTEGPKAGELLLAVRPRRQETLKAEQPEEKDSDENMRSSSKRMAASLAEDEAVKEEDMSESEEVVKVEESSSDAEYEVVAGPAGTGLSLESDSETEGLVVVRPMPQARLISDSEPQELDLPIRQQDRPGGLFVANPDPEVNSDPDSDWTVV